MTAIIEIENLTKKYGKLTALNNLNLTVEEGAVVGFIGPNGAGKTTTMRILTTLLKPTSGKALVGGHSVTADPRSVRQVIGFMPDYFGVYEDMKAWEYLDFFAACYDIPPHVRAPMIDDLLELVDLGHKKESYVEGLSRGMKQRLCLARTLAHDPQVLILDEPASGLDPRARIEMRELLLELRNMGKTIFFSSHILSEIADVCTEIAVMEQGNLVTYDNISAIQRKLEAARTIRVRVLGEHETLKGILLATPTVTEFETADENRELMQNELQFGFTGDDVELSMLLADLISQNVPIINFSEETKDLEDVFMQVTQGIVQ